MSALASRTAFASRRLAATPLTSLSRVAFSTTTSNHRTVVDQAVDSLKSVDRKVSDKLVDGINIGTAYANKLKEATSDVSSGKVTGQAATLREKQAARDAGAPLPNNTSSPVSNYPSTSNTIKTGNSANTSSYADAYATPPTTPSDVASSVKGAASRVAGQASQAAGQAQGKASQAAGQAQGKASEAYGQAKGTASEVAGEVQGKAGQWAGQAGEVAGQARGEAAKVAGDVKGKASEVAGEVKGKAEEVKGRVKGALS